MTTQMTTQMTTPVSGSRKPLVQTSRVRYRWRLREVMAMHGLFMTTDLAPLLASRGINLSPSQIHRLVVGTPERMSMPVLAALCDIFQTDPNDLIEIDSEVAPASRAGANLTDTDPNSGGDAVTDLAARRPTRARINAVSSPAPQTGSVPRPGPAATSDSGPVRRHGRQHT